MFDPKELLNALVGSQGGPAGGLGGILSGALAQAQSGLNAAAGGDLGQRVGGALDQGAAVAGQAASQAGTVLSGAFSQVEGQLQGTQAGAMLDRAKQAAQQNPMAAGAALGGLAAILLGTQTGRAATGDAVKLGGLAILGGLAYKAFKNHQEGKPLTAGIPGLGDLGLGGLGAPQGSGFSDGDHSHDSALLMARAMISAAAADGIVDAQERERILGKMQEAGLGGEAAKFLNDELAHPASAADIAASVGGAKELATQVYMAAVFGAHSVSQPERAFLDDLAKALGLDPALAAHIGATMAKGS
ncbi:Uncharacterized membrane protein YebE, DUF533 family [Rhizobiales bacterium GAS188]|nr:Uncharacterized membrane protein YebE, DUF533 family [Rhizobiales bacterium GAS188]